MLAVVEAKAAYKLPGDGLQQAKDYATVLGLKFAYSTNGHGIVEFDFTTGAERQLDTFPKPAELWERFRASEKIEDEEAASRLLTPANAAIGKGQRYYQEIAINRVVQSVLQGKKRILLTMATGTGKTAVAFQICWKLWNMRWNRAGEHRRPKILYLADRNILIDDPKDKMFTTFGDARWKIENGEVNKGRELYFAIYQAIAKDENRPGLYKEYSKDFFDLIIVDECHRGSAKDDSNWREILRYFEPAFQLGMTATPLRKDNRDTYRYFGNPVYTYSLRQGIEDGFLAPSARVSKKNFLKTLTSTRSSACQKVFFHPIPVFRLILSSSIDQEPTTDIWYYEIPAREGRRYSKSKPMQFEEFSDCVAWWQIREENDQSWKVQASELLVKGCNLDLRNPKSKLDIEHLPPEETDSGA